MSLFKGSGVALITPFKNDVIDDALFISLIEFHIKHSTDALIIGGTTGESATLSKEEKLHIYKLAVKTSNTRIPIVANTGTYNTKESIELSIKAEQLGVDGLLLVTPYYNKPTQRGLFAHFKAIANAVSIPVILYNVPSRTSVNLEAETTILLSKIPNIVAIKEASGNLTQVKTIIEGVTQDFDVYTGNDDLIYDVLKLGGKGVISVVANILPFETHNLCKQFETNEQKALEIQKHLNIFNDVLYIESNPVPVKTVFKLLGIDVGFPRLPLVDMEDSNISILKEAMTKANLKEISL